MYTIKIGHLEQWQNQKPQGLYLIEIDQATSCQPNKSPVERGKEATGD
jgi:hypothetical protein